MKELRRISILILSISFLFVFGQMAPVSSVEVPKPGPKVDDLKEKIRIPCPPIAEITDCTIVEASGGTVGPARLRLAWVFGSGEKPSKLQITVYRKQGTPPAWMNIMPREEPFEVIPGARTSADVTIFRLFSGDYQIVFKAFYSCNRVKEYTFYRHI